MTPTRDGIRYAGAGGGAGQAPSRRQTRAPKSPGPEWPLWMMGAGAGQVGIHVLRNENTAKARLVRAKEEATGKEVEAIDPPAK